MDIKQAAAKKCGAAFEIAIKNCIRRGAKGQKKRTVNMSEADARMLMDFCKKNVRNDDTFALMLIKKASQGAGGSGVTLPAIVFALILIFIVLYLSSSLWPALLVLLTGALIYYLYWARRRAAQKIWANRKGFKRGTEEALENMCLVLCTNPLKFAKYTYVGALCGGIIVTIYQTVNLFIK